MATEDRDLTTKVVWVAVEKLDPHPYKVLRRPYNEEKIEALTASIREYNGLWPSIHVREHPTVDGRYEIISGYHRVEAVRRMKKSEHSELSLKVIPVIIEPTFDDLKMIKEGALSNHESFGTDFLSTNDVWVAAVNYYEKSVKTLPGGKVLTGSKRDYAIAEITGWLEFSETGHNKKALDKTARANVNFQKLQDKIVAMNEKYEKDKADFSIDVDEVFAGLSVRATLDKCKSKMEELESLDKNEGEKEKKEKKKRTKVTPDEQEALRKKFAEQAKNAVTYLSTYLALGADQKTPLTIFDAAFQERGSDMPLDDLVVVDTVIEAVLAVESHAKALRERYTVVKDMTPAAEPEPKVKPKAKAKAKRAPKKVVPVVEDDPATPEDQLPEHTTLQ